MNDFCIFLGMKWNINQMFITFIYVSLYTSLSGIILSYAIFKYLYNYLLPCLLSLLLPSHCSTFLKYSACNFLSGRCSIARYIIPDQLQFSCLVPLLAYYEWFTKHWKERERAHLIFFCFKITFYRICWIIIIDNIKKVEWKSLAYWYKQRESK